METNKIIIDCAICKTKFKGTKDRIYCSPLCRKRANVLYARERLKRTHIYFKGKNLSCKFCKNIFIQNRPSQIFCSRICCKEFYKQVNFNNMRIGKNSLLKLRFEILKRDNFKCVYCGRNPTEDKIKLVIDHIKPKSKGGKDNIKNLITSCWECNMGKGDILLRKRIKN